MNFITTGTYKTGNNFLKLKLTASFQILMTRRRATLVCQRLKIVRSCCDFRPCEGLTPADKL